MIQVHSRVDRRPTLCPAVLLSIAVAAIGGLPTAVDAKAPAEFPRGRHQDFNDGWLFYRGDAEENPVGRGGLAGYLIQAMTPELNSDAWRPVPIPHDWSVEDIPGPRAEGDIGPFKQSTNRQDLAYTVGGIGWYTKAFRTRRSDSSDQVVVHFDGVSYESVVYVNNMAAGSHDYAYTPFSLDITELLRPDGEKNVISMRAANLGDNSRWYVGSGLYRPVTISVLPEAAIDALSVRVVADDVSSESARLRVTANLSEATGDTAGLEADVSVLDESGAAIASTRRPLDADGRLAAELEVDSPRLWSPDTPGMYVVRLALRESGRVVDTVDVPYGIRSLEFSAERGFLLNGEPTLLRGCNLHHDNGLLGAEAWRAADARRVRLLKESGFNAVRCSHNPPSASFLDACDRLGMLVIDEAFDVWRLPKRPQDYHLRFADRWRRDLRAMILRDRNRPSVIMWSIGNEITERTRPTGVAIAKRLAAAVRELDDTRPVTNALCSYWDNPDQTWDADTDEAFAVLDVCGYNYMAKKYESDHARRPDRIMMGTESFPPRAYWFWTNTERLPYVIGDFVWTGMDYIGESGLAYTVYEDGPVASGYRRPWPWFVAWCGDLDLVGDKKPQSRYRDVLWGLSDIEIAVHEPIPAGKVESVNYWGWPKERRHWDWDVATGTEMDVAVYSRCENVALLVNGKPIEGMPIDPNDKLTARFRAPYERGTIEAYGVTKDGRRVSAALKSTGDPAKIRLVVEPALAGFDDGPRFVRIEVCDAVGRVVPTADVDVSLKLDGGSLMAAGSASPNRMASLTQPSLTTFRGRGLAVVLPKGGETTVTASSAGLTEAVVRVH